MWESREIQATETTWVKVMRRTTARIKGLQGQNTGGKGTTEDETTCCETLLFTLACYLKPGNSTEFP